MSKDLRALLTNPPSVIAVEQLYVIRFSLVEQHSGHYMGPVSVLLSLWIMHFLYNCLVVVKI